MKAKEKRVLRELDLRRRKPGKARSIWDARQPGLVLRVRASGHAALAFVFNHRGRTRWLTFGSGLLLADVRVVAARLRLAVVEGRDPAAERKEDREADTFGALYDRYLDYAKNKKKNRAWQQSDYLVRRHLLPRWGRKIAREITTAEAQAAIDAIASPSVANQTRAAASVVFTFGVKKKVLAFNPVRDVERNKMKSRERVLSDSEVAAFWPCLSPALRVLLLTGQRPGEIINMNRAHIRDGWWEMPGAPDAKLGWRGTKNGRDHRVWLVAASREIIGDEDESGNVFPRRPELDAQMREICRRLGVGEKVTPHDLRRSWTTRAAELGVTRLVVDRVLNHVDHSVTGGVYDRYAYSREIMVAMERVAEHLVTLAEGRPAGDEVVVRGLFPSKA
jgi:integrase